MSACVNQQIPKNENIEKKQYTSCLDHNLSQLYSAFRGKILKFLFPAYLNQFQKTHIQFQPLFMPRCFNLFTIMLVPILAPV